MSRFLRRNISTTIRVMSFVVTTFRSIRLAVKVQNVRINYDLQQKIKIQLSKARQSFSFQKKISSSLSSTNNYGRDIAKLPWYMRRTKPPTIKRLFSTSSKNRFKSRVSSEQSSVTKWWQNEFPFMIRQRPYLNMSLSEMTGHAAFVLAIAAYLNTDILILRGLAIGSVSFFLLFQYYRPYPLWIPLKWNVLLLSINTAMFIVLVIERRMASNMPKELEELYIKGLFEERGFSRVEFLRFFRMGKKEIYKRGYVLAAEGEINTDLYFLTKGSVVIKKSNQKQELGRVSRYHFIGEMAFLPFRDYDGDRIPKATADAVIEEDGSVVYVWPFHELREFLGDEREVSNAFSAYINFDLREKLRRTTDLVTNDYSSPPKKVKQIKGNEKSKKN